jgi:hypothetical protein
MARVDCGCLRNLRISCKTSELTNRLFHRTIKFTEMAGPMFHFGEMANDLDLIETNNSLCV